MKNKTYLGALSVAVAAALWGISGIIFIPHLSNLPTFFVVFMMHFLPFLILTVFFYKQYKYVKIFSKMDWLILILISLFGAVLGTVAIVKALFLVNFHHLSVVVLLQKLQPIFAILLAHIILKERIFRHFILLAIITLCGGYFLTFGFNLPTMGKNTATIYACMLAFFAAFCFGSATVFGKCITNNYSSITITFYRYLITTVILGAFLAISGNLYFFQCVTPANWLILILIIFTSGLFSIYLYYIGLKNIKANIAAFCELSMPIAAVTLDYFVNHSYLSPVQLAGGTVMILGIIILVRNQSRKNH
jgi:drug/metabolite transporter (DMT)-like permease